MPYLLILKGANQGQYLPLVRDRTVLGRLDSCDIKLKSRDPEKEASISRKHAIVTIDRDGRHFIEDGDGEGHKSRNKTFVNDAEVPFPKRVHLKPNDIIRICDFEFLFYEGVPTVQETQDEPPSSVDAAVTPDSDSVYTQTVDKLRLLLEVGKRLNKTLEIDALLPEIVDSLMQHFKHADRGFLIEVDEETGGLEPRILRTRRDTEPMQTEFSVSIVHKCVKAIEGLLINDPKNQFPESDSVAGLALQTVMCAPLWFQRGKPFGVLLLDGRNAKKKFTQEDLNFLMGMASLASTALMNARVHRDALERERIGRDLVLARDVVRSFLPARAPEIPGFEFFASNESAQEVGGDYYDFVPLSGGRVGILVGDVAGKGVAAALVMARFSAEARACLRTEPDVAAAVRRLNELMQPLTLTDRFVTLAAFVLDPKSQSVSVVNAGHPPPLLLRGPAGILEEVCPRDDIGPPIAVWDGYPYEAHQFTLQPGDNVILFSDGVTEAMDEQGRELGAPALRAMLQKQNVPACELGARVLQAVQSHAAGSPQHDDITLVCFGRLA